MILQIKHLQKGKNNGDIMEALVPIWEKTLLTITEAAELTNLGQNRIAALCRRANCPFVLYVGRKKLVKRKEFEEYLSNIFELPEISS